jgi:hypothetical protein
VGGAVVAVHGAPPPPASPIDEATQVKTPPVQTHVAGAPNAPHGARRLQVWPGSEQLAPDAAANEVGHSGIAAGIAAGVELDEQEAAAVTAAATAPNRHPQRIARATIPTILISILSVRVRGRACRSPADAQRTRTSVPGSVGVG